MRRAVRVTHHPTQRQVFDSAVSTAALPIAATAVLPSWPYHRSCLMVFARDVTLDSRLSNLRRCRSPLSFRRSTRLQRSVSPMPRHSTVHCMIVWQNTLQRSRSSKELRWRVARSVTGACRQHLLSVSKMKKAGAARIRECVSIQGRRAGATRS